MRKDNPEAKAILADGQLRTARLVGVHFENESIEVSNMRGHAKACYARFALDLDGDATRRVGIRQTVWISDVWLSPGADVRVRAAPDDPDRVVIDWAATSVGFLDAPCPFGGAEGIDWSVIPPPPAGRTDARTDGGPRPWLTATLFLLVGLGVIVASPRLGSHVLQILQRVAGGLLIVVALLLLILRGPRKRVERAGAPVQARVLDATRRGGIVDGGVRMKITLEAPSPEGPRQLSVKRGVPADLVRHVIAGATLPLFFVPERPNQSAIDWPGFARSLLHVTRS